MGFHKFNAKLRRRIKGLSIAIFAYPLNNPDTLKVFKIAGPHQNATTLTVIALSLPRQKGYLHLKSRPG